MEKRLDEAYNDLKRASEKQNKCSLYCELLGEKLSEFDEQTQEYAMFEIDKFIYELKQKKYATQNYIPQYTAPVSTICNQSSTFSSSNFHSPSPTTYTTLSSPTSQHSYAQTSNSSFKFSPKDMSFSSVSPDQPTYTIILSPARDENQEGERSFAFDSQ